jgi:hypothetical protein
MLWFAPVMFALGILFSLLFSALLMFSFVPIYIP